MHSDRVRLFLLSFLMLFVELALIRWTGSNVVYLSYFSNFVLLGSFLGVGLGFLRAKAKTNLFPYAPLTLLGLVCFVLFFPVEIDRSGSNLIYYGGKPSGLPLWVVLPVIFLAVATVMMTIGEGVARVFAGFEPLRGLPTRHPRQSRRYRHVHAVVVPADAAFRLGVGSRRRSSPSC